MVAPVVGRQEGSHGGATPTQCRSFPREIYPFDPALTRECRSFPREIYPFDPALTRDRRAETLLTSSPPE
ncbi:MAG: hypothetical protein VKK80_09025 [Prochlorothrix sp.]|nr:hypothetical protein [Prochlorothrix sp.]